MANNKKSPTKAQASKAGKTLSKSSSPKAKSAAAKVLAKRSAVSRIVRPAPKKGSVSRTTAKSAVKKATAGRNLSTRRKK